MFILIPFVLVFLMSACGDDKEKEGEVTVDSGPEEEVVEEEDLAEEPEEEPEEELNEEDEAAEGSTDFTDVIAYMEEETDGTAEVLYEDNEQQVHESTEDVVLSLNGYTLVELDDFHTNYAIPFDDETSGGVLLAEYTVENKSDEDIYWMPDFYVFYPETEKFHNNNRDLTPEDDQLTNQLAPSTEYLLEAGETVTGLYAYSFAPDILEKVLDLETVTVNINQPHSDEGDVNSNFGEEGKFTLALSDSGAEKAEDDQAFYEDRATYENMGDKEMLKEKDNIGESEDLRDVKVTLDGYQFTEFTPNNEEAPRFESFENGIVLLTVKFLLDNQGDEEISLNGTSSKLTVNNGSQYLLLERMLLHYKNDDVIEPGEEGEQLQVFALDKEQYEKIWKDKDFEIEIGPFKNTDVEDISKGGTVEYTLPE